VVNEEIEKEIYSKLCELEKITGKKFGDIKNPLLVSVRSGARASMPGMMDTILNLGLNDSVIEGLSQSTNNERFAYDSYRRFIQMFSDVVMEIEKSKFDSILANVKRVNGANYDTDLTVENLKEVVKLYKELYIEEIGSEFPSEPKLQLIEAVKAVFRSWNNQRAIVYRRLNDIPNSWGTAVTIQEMVFGNMGNDCGTGVAFTRNPSTGENKLYGEFLMNAQGEDVVAGIRTPQSIDDLKLVMPNVYNEFVSIAGKLENYFKDMQDMEFTIEKGKLFMLQTRNGKRTAAAALKVATDLVSEGMITREEAIMRIEPKQLDQLLHPSFDSNAIKSAKVIAKGLPASPGAATGRICFNSQDVIKVMEDDKTSVILVRSETSPEDIEGMNASAGILTGCGGMTSHAAVVARGMGRCCIAGCSDIEIFENEKYFVDSQGKKYFEGDYISLDGSTGNVYGENIPTVDTDVTEDFLTLMEWADNTRTLGIRTNADTPSDAKRARQFGAEGIGLCRTEHMFFDEKRISAVREMIVSRTEMQRRKALEKLLPMQRGDFEGIFKEMSGFPVTIRLLDPPLHEFLPSLEEDIVRLAEEMNISFSELSHIILSLKEFNPMMGHRGCRLAVTYPEIAQMQTQAIIEASINVSKEGFEVIPEIMIPLIGDINELRYVKNVVVKAADEILLNSGTDIKYKVGTMIEIPRAALTADVIAEEAEFFSFGTNDLTQMTYGFSRDDAGNFLNDYYSKNIFEQDPFAKIDVIGVGKLIEIAATLGRKSRPGIKLGICGEHGGDPSSIEFCNSIGLNYVSCSPFRVPIARLAAAQAVIKSKK
jgi:pyruvate,orthophosphate dikinase